MIKFFLLSFLIFLFSHADSSIDDKNVYYTSQHFRAIAGIAYQNSTSIQTLATKFLDAAEDAWNKEVVELGFLAPRNTQNKLIDIYLGNKSAYDYENGIYVSISSAYAGYAWYYLSDRTPYFVMNSSMTDEQIKVTVAHEFCHTIQYAYFLDDNIAETKWRKNIWWLEATAVLMEDEVYDDINDYINFLSPFFSYSYQSFEIYNGSHEYSMVIFAKYIREKYGMQIIQESLSAIETSGDKGYFEILDDLLAKNYNSSMKSALNEFTLWVTNAKEYFHEGSSYPPLRHYKATDNITIQKGGIEVVDNLLSGWNMVTLSDSNIHDLNISNLKILWSYENGTWKNSVQNQINEVNSSSGYWAKVDENSSLYYTYFDSSVQDISKLDKSWSFVGTTKEFYTNTLANQEPLVIWQYVNETWFVYSNNVDIQQKIEILNYPTLNKIVQFSAYWVHKLN